VTNHAAPSREPGAPLARPARRGFNWSFLGVLPFFLFAIVFMLFPIGFLVLGSFKDSNNNDAFTFANYANLGTQQVARAFANSIEISFVSAVAGALFGLLLAYALILGGFPRVVRPLLITVAGVA
jgi:putative spermidine/putrescine transport system permease protein